MIYSNQIRPELMKQNPEMKITEISGHIAEKWKSLGDTDRAKLQAQADSLRKEYELQKVAGCVTNSVSLSLDVSQTLFLLPS
jgi:hypothetical protein